MWNVKVRPRLAQAGAVFAVALCSFGSAWAIGGTIGNTYQDQVNLSGNKKDLTLNFKVNSDAVVTVNTVTCSIQSPSTPPYEVSLSQQNANGVLVFIPVAFTGQTSSKTVFTAFANNLNYGITKGGRAEILVRWGAAANYDVICSIVGKKG